MEGFFFFYKASSSILNGLTLPARLQQVFVILVFRDSILRDVLGRFCSMLIIIYFFFEKVTQVVCWFIKRNIRISLFPTFSGPYNFSP